MKFQDVKRDIASGPTRTKEVVNDDRSGKLFLPVPIALLLWERVMASFSLKGTARETIPLKSLSTKTRNLNNLKYTIHKVSVHLTRLLTQKNHNLILIHIPHIKRFHQHHVVNQSWSFPLIDQLTIFQGRDEKIRHRFRGSVLLNQLV